MGKYEIKEMVWDSDFFEVKAVKVFIHEKLNKADMELITKKVKKYDFVMYSDLSASYYNDFLIGMYTDAYLVDNNIQLRMLNKSIPTDASTFQIEVTNNFSHSDEILKITKDNIKYSKYYNDPQINNIKGRELYTQWAENAFEKDDKYFITYRDKSYRGYLLFSLNNNTATIELLIIDKQNHSRGLGTQLITELKRYLPKDTQINVGTQIDNIEALNFYEKNGFKIQSNYRIYHKWNIKS